MGRLRRFAEYRFVGVRDTMIVYDCDDEEQYAELAERVAADEQADGTDGEQQGPEDQVPGRGDLHQRSSPSSPPASLYTVCSVST